MDGVQKKMFEKKGGNYVSLRCLSPFLLMLIFYLHTL